MTAAEGAAFAAVPNSLPTSENFTTIAARHSDILNLSELTHEQQELRGTFQSEPEKKKPRLDNDTQPDGELRASIEIKHH